jgi:hypothetical protein
VSETGRQEGILPKPDGSDGRQPKTGTHAVMRRLSVMPSGLETGNRSLGGEDTQIGEQSFGESLSVSHNGFLDTQPSKRDFQVNFIRILDLGAGLGCLIVNTSLYNFLARYRLTYLGCLRRSIGNFPSYCYSASVKDKKPGKFILNVNFLGWTSVP